MFLQKDYRKPACSRQGRNDAKRGVINLDLQGQAGAEPGSDAKGRLTLTFRYGQEQYRAATQKED
ncbi:MAG: hypothetical protein K9I71_05880 [Ignavibacteriales bacterium]|nr:hypothetical protein [Ignavibacteriales bacterium]MCF8315633.1 hypothetical protein [Ignavibacteriales bacterium]MCF8437173.1 hypothetical protein [Ignavibacteriales bacterium]